MYRWRHRCQGANARSWRQERMSVWRWEGEGDVVVCIDTVPPKCQPSVARGSNYKAVASWHAVYCMRKCVWAEEAWCDSKGEVLFTSLMCVWACLPHGRGFTLGVCSVDECEQERSPWWIKGCDPSAFVKGGCIMRNCIHRQKRGERRDIFYLPGSNWKSLWVNNYGWVSFLELTFWLLLNPREKFAMNVILFSFCSPRHKRCVSLSKMWWMWKLGNTKKGYENQQLKHFSITDSLAIFRVRFQFLHLHTPPIFPRRFCFPAGGEALKAKGVCCMCPAEWDRKSTRLNSSHL